MARKRRYLVTYAVKEAQIIEARSPEEAARKAVAQTRTRERVVPNSVVVYEDDDHNGDRPIPIREEL